MCTHNSTARRDNGATLQPLRDNNNQIIPGFPQTLAALDALNGGEIDRLLQALGLATDGLFAARQTRLRQYIGVI